MHFLTKSALYFYGAMKLIFIALFSLSLNYAATVSAKEEITCKGDDLMVGLAASEPQILADLRQQAAKTVYGNSRLWKISKPGLEDSWLFGTMHIAESKISTLPDAAKNAFDQSDKVLVEITDMRKPDEAQQMIIKLKHLTFKLDGSTIETDLSAEQLAKLKSAADLRAIPYQLAIRMQPWMLAPAISNQLCEVAAKKSGKLFLDAKLMKMAVEDGKELVALETTEEQLSAIASMPKETQLAMLTQSLELGEELDDITQTMKNLYMGGEIGLITPVIRYFSDKMTAQSDDGKGFEEFQQKLVVERNIKMAMRAAEHFSQGSVFMAVGALHLPGDTGLVALLEQQGYKVAGIDKAKMTQ